MLALVNRDRISAGLSPVTVDPRLAAIARAHCQDMVDHDFVGHVSKRTGNGADRVRHAGLAPELLLENVARPTAPTRPRAASSAAPATAPTCSIRARAASASAWCSARR